MSDRTWNPVDARLYEEEWSPCAKLVAGVLLARCPNQIGIFDIPWWFLMTLFQGIYSRPEIELSMTEWEADGFAKIYRDHKVIWIVKKWKRAGNPSSKHIIGAENVLASYPEVAKDFKTYYSDHFKGIVTPLKGVSKGIVSRDKPLSNPDSESESDTDTESNKGLKEGGSEKSDPEPLDEELVKFCREIMPARCSSDALLRKQVDALDKLIRLDQEKIDTSGEYSPELWKWEVFDVLRWARADNSPGNSGFCWSDVFQSIPRLREKGCYKYINMRVQFLRATSKTPTPNQKLDDPDKFGPGGKTPL